MQQIALPRSFYYVSQQRTIELSEAAHQRLQALKLWRRLRDEEGLTGVRAAELLKLPRSTLYRWQKRLDERGLRGLEEDSRRPKSCRRPQWTPELAEAVLELREQYGWDKVKLAHMLKKAGWQTSASTVGRIMTRLKARGVLREPLRNGIRRYRPQVRRPHAVRKPKGYAVKHPGDLVQVDTLDVRPLPGKVFKQFTARDMVSRWDVIEAFGRATASNACSFLDSILARSPYSVRAIQVDGGSEFQGEFEQACAEKGIRLFVLPPRSPKLNGHVERAQRTHTEEFHDRYMGDLELREMNRAMREWEDVYNHVRPHYSLDLLTPAEYLAKHHKRLTPTAELSHMS
ncbi:MAG: DDE-type integrase/transposase/recombinase [Anaerolineae bacterium]|nr:DDE-type integrase/transposase/recombinase [Anaerolineae bacterium]